MAGSRWGIYNESDKDLAKAVEGEEKIVFKIQYTHTHTHTHTHTNSKSMVPL